MVEFNLADLFEAAVDAFPEREYLVVDGERRTYAELDQRANRLAHHLAAQGVKAGDHVGIYAYNSVPWVEALWAVFKIRAVWININYRYVEEEVAFLFESADLVALIYQREFAPRVEAVMAKLPMLRHTIVIADSTGGARGAHTTDGTSGAHTTDGARGARGTGTTDTTGGARGTGTTDTTGGARGTGTTESSNGAMASSQRIGSVDYEEALKGSHTGRDFDPRSADDFYILFTGGTTGMPKGVLWRHKDVFFALGGGIDAMTHERVSRPEQMVEKGRAGFRLTSLPLAPLMHGASQWSVMSQSFVGNTVVLVARFQPDQVWRLVEREKVNLIMITGDAMARPLIEALDHTATYDTSSLLAISSTAALFSPSVKEDFFRHFPNLIVTEAIGSSESGNNGLARLLSGQTALTGGPRVTPQPGTVVLDEDLTPLAPGSGRIGRVARSGDIPVGYYNDPAKTAETFVVGGDGVRYSMPGDWATLEADGTITLLGRGSVSINSGGEKIYPEEVEAAAKSHPAVWDAVVVGVPDQRWGQRVAAVLELRPLASITLDDLQEHCRTRVAGYKIPRQLHVVDTMLRSPSGKPDYRWAATVATSAPAVP